MKLTIEIDTTLPADVARLDVLARSLGVGWLADRLADPVPDPVPVPVSGDPIAGRHATDALVQLFEMGGTEADVFLAYLTTHGRDIDAYVTACGSLAEAVGRSPIRTHDPERDASTAGGIIGVACALGFSVPEHWWTGGRNV